MTRETTSGDLSNLERLAVLLPKGLRSDWRNANHYELTAPDGLPGQYWWWQLDATPDPQKHDTQSTLQGERLGLIMDIAEEVARLRDGGALSARNGQDK